MEKKANHLVGSIICGILTAFGIVISIIPLIGGSNRMWALCDCINLVLLFLISYYAIIGYKMPHGNLLKYIILLRLAPMLIGMPTLVHVEDVVAIILLVIEIGLCCYIAGRLVKVKENLILMIIVTICVIVSMVSDIIAGIANINVFAHLVIWLDICVAYFIRYKEHKEAGLVDAPKVK